MEAFRWWLFKRICSIGWWVCPQKHAAVMLATYHLGMVEAEKIIAEPRRAALQEGGGDG